MRNLDGELMFALFFFLLSAMAYVLSEQPTKVVVSSQVEIQKQPTDEGRMRAAGITCPECPDIPNGMERTQTTALSEGYTVEYPTPEYATFLHERCGILDNPFEWLHRGGSTLRRVHGEPDLWARRLHSEPTCSSPTRRMGDYAECPRLRARLGSDAGRAVQARVEFLTQASCTR